MTKYPLALLAFSLCIASSGLSQTALNLLPGTQFLRSGTTAGGPTYNRPRTGTPPSSLSPSANAVRYDAFSFTVAATGKYVFSLAGVTWNPFSVLYQGAFNSSSPLTNALFATAATNSNDTTKIGFTWDLTAGTNYTFVSGGSTNADFGNFNFSIGRQGPAATWTGSLSSSDSRWARPTVTNTISSQNNAHYDVKPFWVNRSGYYNFETTSDFAPYTFIYSTFNPSAPGATTATDPRSLQNLLAVNVGAGSGTNFSANGLTYLEADRFYYSVVSSANSLVTGNYSSRILGPGNVSFGPVPEPASLLALSGALVGLARRRRTVKK